MPVGLTPKQKQIYSFIQQQQRAGGGIPTLKEISTHFRFKSLNSARQHLKLIAKKGYITVSPKQARSIRLAQTSPDLSSSLVRVPLLGSIQAGVPSLALAQIEETILLPKQFFRGDQLFALRVRGDSMIDAGIFPNDIAVINSQSHFQDGEIAAVVIDDEATLKRAFHLNHGALRIHAENKAYPDRIIRPSAGNPVRIAGILVGSLRRF